MLKKILASKCATLGVLAVTLFAGLFIYDMTKWPEGICLATATLLVGLRSPFA